MAIPDDKRAATVREIRYDLVRRWRHAAAHAQQLRALHWDRQARGLSREEGRACLEGAMALAGEARTLEGQVVQFGGLLMLRPPD